MADHQNINILAPKPPTTEIPAPLVPILNILSSFLLNVTELFHRVPGSPIVVRYIQSSYQNDPWRSLLEVLLVAFAVRTIFKGRTRGEGEGKNWVKLTEKEIDELVDEWQPLSLVDEPARVDEETLASVPVIQGQNGVHVKLADNKFAAGKSVLNLASPDWTGMVESESMKQIAIETLKEYGVGSCGPGGFYGTIDVHMKFEEDVAAFLGTEAAIIYPQSFAAVSSAIPAFAKRGDIIVADRGVNFAIHKGLQISRSQIRWYAHGDMKDLERVLQTVERDRKRKGGKLTRRFIISEGIFENDGMLLDLPKLVELKRKFKYRLIIDESHSFGMIGTHGRGITEYFNIPATEIDILFGSMSNGLGAGGGFCAGSSVVCKHQRINSSASVFTASLPAMLATTSSAAMHTLIAQPNLISTLQSNALLFRQILNKLEALPLETPEFDPFYSSSPSQSTNSAGNKEALISIPSHPKSALIHIFLLEPPSTLEEEEALLQDIVDETLQSSAVLITRARRLRGQEIFEPEPSLKVYISSVLNKKEVEKAAQGLKQAIQKVAGKKR